MRRARAALWMWVVLSACDREAALPSRGDATRGRRLYLVHCALCHGESADGRGQRHAHLSPPPADFTSRDWRERASARATFRVIREGKRGTPMPAWPALTDDEVWDLATYVLSVAP